LRADVPVEIETDCANLVAKVMDAGVDRSVSSALIADIKVAINRRRPCVVHKERRSQNEAAHKLAQHALLTRRSKASFSFVPSCIRDLRAFLPTVKDAKDFLPGLKVLLLSLGSSKQTPFFCLGSIASFRDTFSIPKYLSSLFFILTLIIHVIKKIKVIKKSNIYYIWKKYNFNSFK
jgi:hypothetical protein